MRESLGYDDRLPSVSLETSNFFVIYAVVRLSFADLTAAIDTTSEECQQYCGANVEQGNDLI